MVAFACFGAANLSPQSHNRIPLLKHNLPYGQLALWVDVYPVLYGVHCLCNNVVINGVAAWEGGVRHDGGGAVILEPAPLFITRHMLLVTQWSVWRGPLHFLVEACQSEGDPLGTVVLHRRGSRSV